MTTARVFPEPDRWYRVSLDRNGAFVGKLLAINWLTNRGGHKVSPLGFEGFQEVRIRPETLVFEVSKGWEKDEEKFRQRIVRWEAISFVEECEAVEAYPVDEA